jgi:hypothetical protein
VQEVEWMKWMLGGLFIYLLVGLVFTPIQAKKLIIESTGELYDSRHLVRFKVFLAIILGLSVILWPIVLRQSERQKAQRLYVIRDVTSRFTRVSRDRSETLETIELSNLTTKFIHIYEQFGLKMYQEHLEYELEKYREEGLRDNYKDC